MRRWSPRRRPRGPAAARRDRGPLRHPRTGRPRRHGRRLRRLRSGAGSEDRAQAAQRRRRGVGVTGAQPRAPAEGSQGDRAPHPPQRRRRPRRRARSTIASSSRWSSSTGRRWRRGWAASRAPGRRFAPIFLAAGRGLAAAHAARIVHRDFKPQNVMVASDGAVRVMDFGLASDGASGRRRWRRSSRRSATTPTSRARRPIGLTRTGSLIGTPAYMAPEQFRGRARRRAHRSVQLLRLALRGAVRRAAVRRRFARRADRGGRRRAAARAAATRARPGLAAQGRAARPLGQTRGPLPDDGGPARGARPRSGAPAPARARRRQPRRRAARGWRARPARAANVWRGAVPERRRPGWRRSGRRRGADPNAPHPRRDAVRAAFLATGARRAADVWQRTAANLDAYARRWTAMYGETCEATHVRGEQSAEVLDLRMDCLNRNRDSLRALTDVLAAADVDMVGNAIDAAAALPDVARCADVAVLRVVLPPPRDPLLRQQVDRLRQRAAEARALGDAGRWKQGIAKAQPLLDEAAKLGYEPVVAEVLALLGFLDGMMGDAKEAAEYSERALVAGRGDPVRRGRCGRGRDAGRDRGLLLGRPEEGERWGRFADAILKRMGPGHERLQAWLANNRGESRVYAGELATAEPQLLDGHRAEAQGRRRRQRRRGRVDEHARGAVRAAWRAGEGHRHDRSGARHLRSRVRPGRDHVRTRLQQPVRISQHPRPLRRGARLLPEGARDLGGGARNPITSGSAMP